MCFFFFNCTATTGSYTYGHTLSLHDALPIYPSELQCTENVTRFDHLPPEEHRAFYNSQRFTLNVTRVDMVRAGWSPSVRLFEAAACGTRSEEHTYELQSLMRISYAVFCFKKKTNSQLTTHDYQYRNQT